MRRLLACIAISACTHTPKVPAAPLAKAPSRVSTRAVQLDYPSHLTSDVNEQTWVLHNTGTEPVYATTPTGFVARLERFTGTTWEKGGYYVPNYFFCGCSPPRTDDKILPGQSVELRACSTPVPVGRYRVDVEYLTAEERRKIDERGVGRARKVWASFRVRGLDTNETEAQTALIRGELQEPHVAECFSLEELEGVAERMIWFGDPMVTTQMILYPPDRRDFAGEGDERVALAFMHKAWLLPNGVELLSQLSARNDDRTPTVAASATLIQQCPYENGCSEILERWRRILEERMPLHPAMIATLAWMNERNWSLALAQALLARLAEVDSSRVVPLANAAAHIPRRYAGPLQKIFLDVLRRRMATVSRAERDELMSIAAEVRGWNENNWSFLPRKFNYAPRSISEACSTVRQRLLGNVFTQKDLPMPGTPLATDEEDGSLVTEADVRRAPPERFVICQ